MTAWTNAGHRIVMYMINARVVMVAHWPNGHWTIHVEPAASSLIKDQLAATEKLLELPPTVPSG